MINADCPYVMNPYYKYTQREPNEHCHGSTCGLSSQGIEKINYCNVDRYADGSPSVSYMYVCMNNTVYARVWFDSEVCEGTPTYQPQVTAIPSYSSPMPMFSYLCPANDYNNNTDDCNNKVTGAFHIESVTNDTNNCSPSDNPTYYPFKSITNVCAPNSYGVLSSAKYPTSKMVRCNETGIYTFRYNNTWNCDNEPIRIIVNELPGCNSLGGDLFAYWEMFYCNGINYTNSTLIDSISDEQTTSTLMPIESTSTTNGNDC